MRIAELTLEQKDQWLGLRNQLWPVENLGEHEKEISEFIVQKEFCAWGAWQGDQLIGFAEVFIRPFANGCESRPVPFLEGVWVNEANRADGVGSQLLSAVEGWAKERGFSEMGSDADIENTLSLKVHEKWGFEEAERVVCFRKVLK